VKATRYTCNVGAEGLEGVGEGYTLHV
jgi:hypothetical protein